MRTFIVGLYLLAIIWILSILPGDSSNSNDITTSEGVRGIGNEIIEGYMDKDTEKIKSVFSEYHLYRYGRRTEREIEKSFEFIDGEIVSYEGVSADIGTGEVRDYEWTRKSLRGTVYKIKTDTDKEYEIEYSGYAIYKEDSEKEGVSWFKIIEIGQGEEKSFRVGVPD